MGESKKVSIAESDGEFRVQFLGALAAEDCEFLDSQIKIWLVSSCQFFVLDFEKVQTLDASVYRPLVAFHRILKKNGKHSFSINLGKEVIKQVKADGLVSVFNPTLDFPEEKKKILSKSGSKRTLDVEFIKPFIVSTLKVLKTQANIEAAAGKPFLKGSDHDKDTCIVGVLSMNSSQFNGSLALCFSDSVFKKIYSGMTGEEILEITQETADAVGELLNIIFGQAKTILNDQLKYNVQKALPTVLVGEKLKIRQQTGSSVVLPFESTMGKFYIEISLDDQAILKADINQSNT